MHSLKIYLNMTLNWRLISIVLGLLVSGCATMGKNECLNAQWQSVGYEDGAKGFNASRIGEHRKACAKYNISPELEAYSQGRLQGLAEWCTPSNGYYQGTRGVNYNGVCPKQLETAFQLAMNQGREVYDYRKKIQGHEGVIARLHNELHAIEEEISFMEAELFSDQVRPRRRRDLLDEIRAAERDRELVRYDISEAEYALDEMRRDLENMKAQNNY